MKPFWSLGLLGVSLWPPQNPPPRNEKPVKLYALLDDKKNQWCGYTDETRWKSETDRTLAETTASIEFINRHPRVVVLWLDDDAGSGDWAVQQTYKLNDAGEILWVEAITNVLPGDFSRKEIYQRRGSRLVRTSVKLTSMTTKLPLTEKPDWTPSLPVYKTASALPMAPLIARSREILSGGTLCTYARSTGSGD